MSIIDKDIFTEDTDNKPNADTTIDSAVENTDSQVVRGITGSTGMQGVQGLQGRMGPTGTQGAQGRQGLQGTQGRVGPMGMRGPIGAQGIQGVQGFPGFPGFQGVRGCVGVQGPAGSAGVQGIQGKAGRSGYQGRAGVQGIAGARGMQGVAGQNGACGMQGVAGTQGARGMQGVAGMQGYMGYKGSDGIIGIQGVQGEKASVWVDGIRLDGYNTHLFEFDINEQKFVSKNQNKDLLYLRNGAKISIWLDSNAINALANGSSIKIDKLDNGTEIETNYPAYYAGTRSLYSVIDSSRDTDTTVELTFKDGAWYYSGGIIKNTAIVTTNVFQTLNDAQQYINSLEEGSADGMRITVYNDPESDNNGIYYVSHLGDGEVPGELVKVARGTAAWFKGNAIDDTHTTKVIKNAQPGDLYLNTQSLDIFMLNDENVWEKKSNIGIRTIDKSAPYYILSTNGDVHPEFSLDTWTKGNSDGTNIPNNYEDLQSGQVYLWTRLYDNESEETIAKYTVALVYSSLNLGTFTI